LNNYGEVFPFISDISYVHGYPFFSGEGDNQYGLPLWPYSKWLYMGLYRGLSESLSRVVIANSSYTARIIGDATGKSPEVVYPFVEQVRAKMYKTGNVLTISRINHGKNLNARAEDEALRETLGGGPWRGQRSSLLNGSGAGCAPSWNPGNQGEGHQATRWPCLTK
jgi:hypothetical protein